MDPSYVLDSTVLIDLSQHFHSRQIRDALGHLASASQVKISEGVQRELGRKSDWAHGIVQYLVKKYPNSLVQIDRVPRLGEELARIERLYGEEIRVGTRHYPGFWKSAHGRKAVDGQVVALAKKPNLTAVSDDRAVRLACMLEGIPCVGWTDFARTLGLHQQLSLLPRARKG